ncbi:hypothetical protein N9I71_00020 [Amylibacter sp.]|nr:hypothetical protein [Amylibacter sp.]MDA8913854.1 hypothetical protein [Amylibacter sp.]MDB4080047.1 hypothetical protein [Amylibacter sp.]
MTEYSDYNIQIKLKQNNYKYLNILICTLSLFLCYGFSTYAKPPFPGTAYVDKDIIQKNDPSDFINLEYVGLVKENPYDYRADAWVAQDMFVFNVKYKNKKGTRIRVNSEFENVKNAQRQAERYAFVVGQMPYVLLRDLDTITIHKGKENFGGGNRDILVHTGSGDDLRRDGFLEEVIFHEACHTSLDADAYQNPAWEKARLLDNNFISVYALENPNREDVAESCLMYFALKYRPDRIPNGIKNLILKTIPSRIDYFDKYVMFENDTYIASLGAVLKTLGFDELPCSSEVKTKSTDSGKSVRLKIFNNSKSTTLIYWLNYDGKRNLYHEIKSGDMVYQETSLLHPWLASSRNGTCQAMGIPVDDGIWVIN